MRGAGVSPAIHSLTDSTTDLRERLLALLDNLAYLRLLAGVAFVTKMRESGHSVSGGREKCTLNCSGTPAMNPAGCTTPFRPICGCHARLDTKTIAIVIDAVIGPDEE